MEQTIILTHYPLFVRRFSEIVKTTPIKFIKIEKRSDGSHLLNASERDFTTSQYEEIFEKIYGFIQREHTDDIRNELRKFFEDLYLPTIFAKRIRDKGISLSTLKLSEKIDVIFDEDAVKQRMHSFRETLNPESHTFTLSNNEDVINFASEMMDYLYAIELK